MADNSKLNYLSTWDIDQLYATNTVGVGIGTTALYTIPSELPSIPTFEVQFRDSGRWYQAGAYSTNGTLANLFSFYTYVQSGVLYIVTTKGGSARYFVWTDKVNY